MESDKIAYLLPSTGKRKLGSRKSMYTRNWFTLLSSTVEINVHLDMPFTVL